MGIFPQIPEKWLNIADSRSSTSFKLVDTSISFSLVDTSTSFSLVDTSISFSLVDTSTSLTHKEVDPSTHSC